MARHEALFVRMEVGDLHYLDAVTVGPFRLSPRRTGGHCGPPTCGPAASTTLSAARADPDLLARLTIDERSCNALHGALRCLGERANSVLKTTYKALRRYCGCPWRLGDIVAAPVLLHHEHGRTT